MYTIPLGKSELSVPTVAVGCMRFGGKTVKEVEELIDVALANGANFFDHADIYGAGRSEEIFAEALTPARRDQVILQTKCGIVPGKMFDFSHEHIVRSVEGSLKRLGTEYIDVLLLHRPDTLMEPEEVARAFDKLKTEGKVRHFGVSNQNPMQMQLLQSALDMPLVVNQLQFGVMHTPMLQSGFNVNMCNEAGINRDGGVLDFCRLNKITIQPWSPMQFGFFQGCFVDNEQFPELNAAMEAMAEKYGVSKTTLAFAWILRHPAKMQPVTGTTTPARLADCLAAANVTLTREDWYALYQAAGNVLP